MWQRVDSGRLVKRAVMDYNIVERSALGLMVNVNVPRGADRAVINF